MSPKSDFRCWFKHHGSKKSEDHKSKKLGVWPWSSSFQWFQNKNAIYEKLYKFVVRLILQKSKAIILRLQCIVHVHGHSDTMTSLMSKISKMPFSKILSRYYMISHPETRLKLMWVPVNCSYSSQTLKFRDSLILFQLNTVMALLELRIKFCKVQTVQRATA